MTRPTDGQTNKCTDKPEFIISPLVEVQKVKVKKYADTTIRI